METSHAEIAAQTHSSLRDDRAALSRAWEDRFGARPVIDARFAIVSPMRVAVDHVLASVFAGVDVVRFVKAIAISRADSVAVHGLVDTGAAHRRSCD
jgi:hypothetical protein